MLDHVNILIVDDSEADFELTRAALTQQTLTRYEFVWEKEFTAALQRITGSAFDVILLDFKLGAHDGLDLLRALRAAGVRTPVLMLTGFSSPDVDMAAMRAGASDFIPKDHLDPLLLERSIRYAVERQRLLDKLEQMRLEREQVAEFQALDNLPGPESAPATARIYGMGPLRESDPAHFNEAVRAYAVCLERALEERTFKIDRTVSAKIKDLGQQMGFLGSSARDAVDIHTTALRQCIDGVSMKRAHAMMEEGRLLLVELMGHLVTYYRLGRGATGGAMGAGGAGGAARNKAAPPAASPSPASPASEVDHGR